MNMNFKNVERHSRKKHCVKISQKISYQTPNLKVIMILDLFFLHSLNYLHILLGRKNAHYLNHLNSRRCSDDSKCKVMILLIVREL